MKELTNVYARETEIIIIPYHYFITNCLWRRRPSKVEEPAVFDYQTSIDNAITDIVSGIILLVEKPDFKFLGSAGLAEIETDSLINKILLNEL